MASLPSRRLVAVALTASLALLLAHAALYAFLCDDAFISFRYAANLAHGAGLVFNPGFERVEGYTNFLWVLLLAAFDRIGIAPERAAIPLSLAATIGLWALVAWWGARRAGAGRGAALAALSAPFLLACHRTVAVWSTSGLETRLFETLALAGTLRAILELEDDASASPRLRPWSGVLLALATLTRPDGALVGGCVLGAGTLLGRGRRRAWGPRWAGFVLPVAAHEAFRIAYYGALVPNTFAAKIGGRTWWDMGLAYAGAFVLEYGVFLWLPLLVLAWRRHAREGSRHVPLVFGAAVLPHLVYVVAIGGDHFEYRPLGLLVPFAVLLLADGLGEAAARWGRGAAIAAAAAVVFGVVWLPLRSHLEFPRERYRNGFPGVWVEDGAAERWMDPAADPILGWPPMRSWPRAHRALLQTISGAAVGLRQEEHALFLASVLPEGARLRALVASGRIPATLHVAIACVGAIPYESGLRTLDRLGLTDRTVASMASVSKRRVLAHERRDTAGYEKAAGVDVSSYRAAHLLASPADPAAFLWIARAVGRRVPVCAARLTESEWLVGALPQGIEATRARYPELRFADLADPAAFAAFVGDWEEVARARHAASPRDLDATIGLAQARLLAGRAAAARELFEGVAATAPDRLSVWIGLAAARAATGDPGSARAALERAAALAARRGATDDLADIEALRGRIAEAGAPPPQGRRAPAVPSSAR